MCASGRAIPGFQPRPDSVLCFHDMPMFVTTGMVVKARLDFGTGLKPGLKQSIELPWLL